MELTIGVFFDGTANSRFDDEQVITNVAKLFDVYDDSDTAVEKLYVRGVGSNPDSRDNDQFSDPGIDWDHWLGLITGRGGHERVALMRTMVAELVQRHNATKVTFDVFGFSRGAALARDFINKALATPLCDQQQFRFLGIYDTVGSFGTPGNDEDKDFDFSISEVIDYVYHITSFDELRWAYDVHSIKKKPEDALPESAEVLAGKSWRIEQCCPGVHADIGGGYMNARDHARNNNFLSRYYLRKMYLVAKERCKLPLKQPPEGGEQSVWYFPKSMGAVLDTMFLNYFQRDVFVRKFQILRNMYSYRNYAQRKYKNAPRGSRGGNGNNRRRIWQAKYKRIKNKLIPTITDLFIRDALADGGRELTQLISQYNSFHQQYIHVSHSPVNSFPGMAMQFADFKDAVASWPALSETTIGEYKEIVRRGVFYSG